MSKIRQTSLDSVLTLVAPRPLHSTRNEKNPDRCDGWLADRAEALTAHREAEENERPTNQSWHGEGSQTKKWVHHFSRFRKN